MRADAEVFYLKEFDRYTESFFDSFSSIDKKSYNQPMAPGKWTPGQLVQHMTLSELGTIKLLNMPAAPVRDRDAEQKCPQIRERMTDLTVSKKAPASLEPELQNYPMVEALDNFADTRADVRVAFEFADDITALVTAYSHPIFAELTRCEWFYFSALHGERHRLQFEAYTRQ